MAYIALRASLTGPSSLAQEDSMVLDEYPQDHVNSALEHRGEIVLRKKNRYLFIDLGSLRS